MAMKRSMAMASRLKTEPSVEKRMPHREKRQAERFVCERRMPAGMVTRKQ